MCHSPQDSGNAVVSAISTQNAAARCSGSASPAQGPWRQRLSKASLSAGVWLFKFLSLKALSALCPASELSVHPITEWAPLLISCQNFFLPNGENSLKSEIWNKKKYLSSLLLSFLQLHLLWSISLRRFPRDLAKETARFRLTVSFSQASVSYVSIVYIS